MEQPQPLAKVTTVGNAVQYFNALRLPLTFTEATAYLRSLWHSANLLSLYRHYFPQEFAASTASTSLRVRGEYNELNELNGLYSPKEIEFLHLVEDKLFPIYLDYYLEGDEREDCIYIPSFGPDWWSYEFEELHAGWQLLLRICGSVEEDRNIANLDTHRAGVEAAFTGLKRHKVDWNKFRAICLAKDVPISYLPLAFDMLDHDTGNIFLDPTDEMPVEPLEWSIEDLDFLIEHYEEATTSLEKAEKLLDWLTASPLHLQEVIELWNECLYSQTPNS
ncbi:MAG TPA: hypothetical protein VH186_03680 [Chloroflexia bacterium]|nr:hypothetical protein [Chloroflexia bacterium]